MIHGIKRRLRFGGWFLLLATGLLACPVIASAEPEGDDTRTQAGEVFACSGIEAGRPLGRSVVFSAAQGTLYCYSDFTRVAEVEHVTHRWFFLDREVAHFNLTLQPPRWSAYSSLKVTPDKKGPWRVDVLDQDGVVYGTARFSIVD
jgi:hypothetical protein